MFVDVELVVRSLGYEEGEDVWCDFCDWIFVRVFDYLKVVYWCVNIFIDCLKCFVLMYCGNGL